MLMRMPDRESRARLAGPEGWHASGGGRRVRWRGEGVCAAHGARERAKELADGDVHGDNLKGFFQRLVSKTRLLTVCNMGLGDRIPTI